MHRDACKQSGPCPISPRVSQGVLVAPLLVGCLGLWLVYMFCVSGGAARLLVDALGSGGAGRGVVLAVSHARVGDGALQSPGPVPA